MILISNLFNTLTSLQTLSFSSRVLTSNIFPQGVTDILSLIFNIADNSDLKQYFQEVIDTIDISVNHMIDEDPTFIPLSKDANIPHQMINASGLRQLKSM